MKKLLILAVLASLVLSVAGCSSVGGKAVERKVKKNVPGMQTKEEKAAKKVNKAADDAKSKVNRR